MAEFVQQSIEDILPELEALKNARLMKSHETTVMLKRRKAFEYRLRRKTKEKEDFLQYAQYEMNVLQLLRRRREKLRYYDKKADIEVPIVQRIHRIFRMAYNRFQDDTKLYLSHIDFCKKKKQSSLISSIYARMLRVHNRKPEIWVMAAKHEIEWMNAMENARPLLQRGIRFNTKSPLLWKEYFRMELMFAEKMRIRRSVLGEAAFKQLSDENASDAVLAGGVAYVVFKQAAVAIPDDVQFLLSFVSISQIFDFTEKLKEDILNDIQFDHGNSEHVRAVVARQHLRKVSKVMRNPELGKVAISEQCMALEEQCYEAFEAAVKEVPTELMYSLYLETLLEKLNKKSKKHHKRRLKKTLSVFQRAKEVQCLSTSLALKWCDVLGCFGQAEELSRTLTEITEIHPSCAPVWHARLSHCVTIQDTSSHILEVFTQACNKVKAQDQLSLWELMYKWLTLCHEDELQPFLQRGVLSASRDVAVKAKIWWLECDAIRHGVSQARKTYKRLCTSQPLSLDFFRTYIELENSQPLPDIKLLRSAYEDAVREFGSSSVELWLSFIKLELSEQGSAPNAGQLHWRAMRALDGPLLEDFTRQYTLAHTGVVNL